MAERERRRYLVRCRLWLFISGVNFHHFFGPLGMNVGIEVDAASLRAMSKDSWKAVRCSAELIEVCSRGNRDVVSVCRNKSQSARAKQNTGCGITGSSRIGFSSRSTTIG